MKLVQVIINRVKKTIDRYQMIAPGDLMVVGVSGGPDSVCLLDILYRLRDELNIQLVVAHFDHGLRPDEDESETRFVRQIAMSLDLPFFTEKAASIPSLNGSSQEEKSRNARYEFFEKIKEKSQARKIAVGHTLNDQAETVIMRFLRGSGPTGLGGIPPCREPGIIRPIIEIDSDEVMTYLKEIGRSYIIDSSNLETRYLRNKIRLELIPQLLKYQPRLFEHLGDMAEIMRNENRYLDMLAEEWIKKEGKSYEKNDIAVPLSLFQDLPGPLKNRVTRSILFRMNGQLRRIDRKHVASIVELAKSKKSQGYINLPSGLEIRKTYDMLVFCSGERPEFKGYEYHLGSPGVFDIKEIGRALLLEELNEVTAIKKENSETIAYLDAGLVRYPLIIRNFRPGDRFIPLGMKGHKKIKDFFIDLKIPSLKRKMIPIIFSSNNPVWVCGYRIDDRFKVTPSTTKILKLTIK